MGTLCSSLRSGLYQDYGSQMDLRYLRLSPSSAPDDNLNVDLSAASIAEIVSFDAIPALKARTASKGPPEAAIRFGGRLVYFQGNDRDVSCV
jgi:hypothetical protein